MKTSAACLLVGGLVFGCQKSAGTDAPAASSAAAAPSVPGSAASGTPAAPAPAATNAPAPAAGAAAVPAAAPESFANGKSETIAAAVGLGCEAKSLDGWLELLCRKKNGTGGHPVRALINESTAAAATPAPDAGEGEGEADAGPSNEILADEKRELRLVLPFRAGEKQSVTMEWSDTRYELKLDGTSASFDWAGSVVSHRKACQALLTQNQARIADAQKLEGAAKVLPAEAKKLPKFGTCQPAGLGSWALSLTRFEGAGEGAARSLVFDIDVVRIDLEGQRVSAPFGSIEVAPGGLEIASLQAYDFDDDGKNELIVPYEINAVVPGKKAAAPSPIWTLAASGISAYAKAPVISGGLGVEHLDFDMRPDIGSYGPFVAWLGSDCGAKTCPTRVTGPKFFFHSLPDGGFSANDAGAQGALGRACSSKPASVVVAAGGNLNVQQTAKNLVCARVRGVPAETIKSELTAKQAELCGAAASCPLATVFEGWAGAALPAELAAGSEQRAAAAGKP